MKVRLPSQQAQKLVAALQVAGPNEIGGQLYGEQIAVSDFLVTDLSVQRRRGTFARFVVDLVQAARDSIRFFERTRHQYSRYNYIGEWHSHPSFAVRPSETDRETMRSLVKDASFSGTFAVLMIVRIDGESLTTGAWVFDPRGTEKPIEMEVLGDN